ncbi:Alpha-aspartyl dipeptidase Peptidase E [Streptococcus sp. DD11]|uniref:Type 1 glutamine amidotransferase-like domain-containing protein n=1 Tax=Streptococcus sp. DD11 TaxID=1777879 RepID=UPI000799EC69|nr:Type 1 glutamine amidotransferase-like domain-containing protein [Streptococcus sp. DD11]KXT79765.1 Alpha-aspartyl dipeptidase Peptidase E [Streptococcus sp. DD11]
MKQLFLCSYFAGVKDLFQNYAKQKGLSGHVLFIPTAGNAEEYTGYIDEAKEVFADLGFELDVFDLAQSDRETAQAKIFQTKLLYISGGNTFYLLQELKKKQLLGLIKEQIADGMVYVGESAGAIIASSDILYNQIMDDKTAADQLTDYSALAETDFYVVPHVGEEPFVESAQATLDTYQDQLHLLPLTNSQAVIVEENEVHVRKEAK